MSSNDVRLEERCVKVMTLHAAKGLEFPIVAIAHVEADRLPTEPGIADAQERQEHLHNQRRLFYVGCTRAMRYLFITHDRSLPSPFLDGLSDDRWLRLSS
jgi:superfamily I DNA/RNA helicase